MSRPKLDGRWALSLFRMWLNSRAVRRWALLNREGLGGICGRVRGKYLSNPGRKVYQHHPPPRQGAP